jgi:CBS domain-containing protein
MSTKTDESPRRHASLAARTVAEAMHPGLLTCPPEAPLREVARMMATYRVHAIVVYPDEDHPDVASVWGVVSDSDLAAAAAVDDIDGRTAGASARTPTVTVMRGESLQRAAELMRRYDVGHLIVVSSSAGRPIGVLSTFDLARAVALEPGYTA